MFTFLNPYTQDKTITESFALWTLKSIYSKPYMLFDSFLLGWRYTSHTTTFVFKMLDFNPPRHQAMHLELKYFKNKAQFYESFT